MGVAKRNFDDYKPNDTPKALKMIIGADAKPVNQQVDTGNNNMNVGMIEMSVPALAYDGGFISVPIEVHDEAVSWFTKHTGWIIQHQFGHVAQDDSKPVMRDRKTILGFGTCIQSFVYRDGVDPLHTERSTETNVRWCWRTRNLRETMDYLQRQGAKVGKPYRGPGNHEYCDFWAMDQQIQLTAQEDAAIGPDQPRLVPSWTRIGVSDLDAAKNWYEAYVGMRMLEDHSTDGYLIMGLNLEHHPNENSLWVLEKSGEARSSGRLNGAARPNCVLHDKQQFAGYHAFLINEGVVTSDIMGHPPVEGFSWFHFYDQDGNRCDVVRY